ncbi:hypothetical protein MBLNU457_4490t1 [Dothideomycetes sp. NU457]
MMFSASKKPSNSVHEETTPVKKRHPLLCISGMLVWSFIIAVDTTCLATALPVIAVKLNANDTDVYWAGTSFVLCSAICQPILSAVSDAIGRKPIVYFSLLMFTVGSIICAVAQNIATLVAGRSVQGIGAAGLVMLIYVLLADLFNMKERAKVQSVVAIMFLVGAVIGPIMAGGFADNATWRWIFWFNLPFCGLAFLLTILFLEIPHHASKDIRKGLLLVDWFGAFLFAASLTSFLIAISWGGVMFAWASWKTLLPLILGIVGLVIWGLYSELLSKNPVIPLRIMSNKTAAINYYSAFVHGFLQFGLTYVLPLYYQGVKGYSPLISGVAALPQCATSGPFTTITGMLIAKTHQIKIFSLIGWAIFVLGFGLLQVLDTNTSIAGWIFLNLPSGIGLGILFSSIPIATMNAAECKGTMEEIIKIKTMAACLNPFFRALGQAVAIAVGQAIVSNEMKRRLHGQYTNSAAGLAPMVKHLPLEQQVIVKEAFVGSTRVVWWLLFALGISAGLLTLLTLDQRILVRPVQPVHDKEKAAPELHTTAIPSMTDDQSATEPDTVRHDSQFAK